MIEKKNKQNVTTVANFSINILVTTLKLKIFKNLRQFQKKASEIKDRLRKRIIHNFTSGNKKSS